MRFIRSAAAYAALGGFLTNSIAQGYPARPARFIVPFAPGGGTDMVARIIGHILSDAWGQAEVIDNRPGAGSTVGTALAAKSPADGYTLLMNSISLAFDTTIYKDLPYDPVRDLGPVARVFGSYGRLLGAVVEKKRGHETSALFYT